MTAAVGLGAAKGVLDGAGVAVAVAVGGIIGVRVGSALELFEAVGAAGMFCDGAHAISRQAASSHTSLFGQA